MFEETLISVESDAWQMEMEFLENKEALVTSDTATPEIREILKRVSKMYCLRLPSFFFFHNEFFWLKKLRRWPMRVGFFFFRKKALEKL